MTAAVDLSGFVVKRADGASEIDFAVHGMTCAACMAQIERAVAHMPGAPSARVNYSTRRLRVAWRDALFRPEAVVGILAPLGYRAQPFEFEAVENEDAAQAKYLIRCMAIAGFAAMNVMLLSVAIWAGAVSGIDLATRDLFHWISGLIALPAALFAGQPFFRSAIAALTARRLNMDVPISIGLTLALGMSVVETMRHAEHAYFESALMLMFFLLAGRALDHGMRRKTRGIVNNLASLRAVQACRLGPDGPMEVPATVLRPGDVVLVRSGERLPADGVVTSGEGEIDDSVITGETARRAIRTGSVVYAGSLNFGGAIHVQVGASGASSLLDEIEQMLEAASTAKSRYLRLADRAARIYAPVVHLAALSTAIGWLLAGASWHDALITAIAVLIITCPCALALAVPAVHVAAGGALFKAGILLRNGEAIERLAEIDTVVFDKTGTLTTPEPRVANRDDAPADLLSMAARLALSSRHPLARSLAVEARDAAPFEIVAEDAGRGLRTMIDGVEARLGSLAYCGLPPDRTDDRRESKIAFRFGARSAIFHIDQTLRPDAAATIHWLKRQGLEFQILSGDVQASVADVGRTLGIAEAFGGLKPAEKVARLAASRDQGRKTLMVGDGLNDAPSLAAAYASLSPATAADIAQSATDAIFLGDRLAPVCAAIAISRAARRRMLQNLTLAAVYNVVAVPLAIFGIVTPLIAAFAMSASSLIVTANALRQWRSGPDRAPDKPALAQRSMESTGAFADARS
jgi:Cu2+-exporting ATPase